MIDTHCHIYAEEFFEDIEQVLRRAKSVGVESILMPAIDRASMAQMEKLPEEGVDLRKMVGLHPCSVKQEEDVSDLEQFIRKWVEGGDVVAIGETGLDYYWDDSNKDRQKEAFVLHLELSKEYDLPVVIHNRSSTADMLSLLTRSQDGRLRPVWHCFNGSLDEGKKAIDLGAYLGIGGVLTFKNAGVDRTVAQLPLDRLILETDAPYLSPVPYRGKRNEPAYLEKTAARLAQIHDIEVQEVNEKTTETAKQIFDL